MKRPRTRKTWEVPGPSNDAEHASFAAINDAVKRYRAQLGMPSPGRPAKSSSAFPLAAPPSPAA